MTVLAAAGTSAHAVDHPQRALLATVDLAACRAAPASAAAGEAWRCEGMPGQPIYVAMAGKRTYLSAGAEPEKRRAAGQTLTAANTPVDTRSRRIAIEWRLDNRGKQARAHAIIVRYFTARGQARGEVLVVSRIGERDSCQVALIDALANPNAMTLARAIADGEARRFDCGNRPKVVGRTGRSPM